MSLFLSFIFNILLLMGYNNDFANLLINWYIHHKRDLPWRNTNDPYKILISEVILQQTRVNQGIDYYNRFIDQFPNIQALANASDDEVLKTWQGLGYYSRARNLHQTARSIVEDHKGVIPSDYKILLSLKGIGKYIAAAVASIAYNQPYPVIDGNVYRVLSRYFADHHPINTSNSFNHYFELINQVFDPNRASLFNQAIMELGALVCLPKNPACQLCPLKLSCIAYKDNIVNQLPEKLNRKKQRLRYFYYYVITTPDNYIVINRRSKNDIWKLLYDFPMDEFETPQTWSWIKDNSSLYKKFFSNVNYSVISEHDAIKHQLTHQTLFVSFMHIRVEHVNQSLAEPYFLIQLKKMSKLAVPKVIEQFLKKEFDISK